MPIYEYFCSECGGEQENLIRNDEQPVCNHCGSDALKRKLSVFAALSPSEPVSCGCAAGGCEAAGIRNACGHGGGCGCA